MKKAFLLFLWILCPLMTPAALQADPVPMEQAFQFSAMAQDNQTVVAIWKIKKGFYLYRDRIYFSPVHPKTDRLGQPLWPEVDTYKDYPGLGKLGVYTGDLQIAIPVIASQQQSVAFQATYQGCAQAGYCYPPTTKTVQVNLAGNYKQPVQPLDVDIAPGGIPTALEMPIQASVEHKNFFLMLISFFGLGVLLSLTPCVLPMIPILSGIIMGQRDSLHPRAFTLSLAYVFGMAVTYAIAGLLFGWLGGTVQAIFQKPWIIVLFSLVFVAMALSLFGLYELQLPERWRQKITSTSNQQKRGSYMGAMIMGCLSTLIVSPCVTPPLVGALSYIGQTGNALLGGFALLSMGIGMGVPLLAIGAFGTTLLPKAGPWMQTIKMVLGLLMLGVAIWMLGRILFPAFVLVLWGGLAISAAIAFGAFASALSKRRLVGKGIGILLFIYGIILIVGGLLGNTDPLKPLHLRQQVSQATLRFIPIKTVEEVAQQLQISTSQKKLTMLDFYADWCVSCQQMDRHTFTDPAVQETLSQFRLLRADVTKNTALDKSLERHFNVVAPPSLLFFNQAGEELVSLRIVGEMSAKTFQKHLQQVVKTANLAGKSK